MQPFIPAAELKQAYGVFGHFYSVVLASKEVIDCRSVLEIAENSRTSNGYEQLSQRQPDAVFIMMNPGSSKPLVETDNRLHARSIHKLAISLVPTRPDTTQYQVMRLMHFLGWGHVRVLNLSDIRSPKSAEFIKRFQRLEMESKFEAHSIFAESRREELSRKFPRSTRVPMVLAWGISDHLTPLIDRCMSRLVGRRNLRGVLEPGTTKKYRHPLPSLQKAQRHWLEQALRQFEK